jgi:acyl-CoA thioester hydrolase
MKPYIYTFTVKEEDIDFNKHVNNVVYLAWMIEAATEHGMAVGSGYDKCLEFGGTWVAKSHTIEYKKPSFLGDELQMKTWIEDIGKILSTRCYELTRVSDGALILEGKTQWVFVDEKKMRPMKIPPEVIEGFLNS